MSDGDPLIMGIDPGLTGAIAVLSPQYPGVVSAGDMPVAGKHIDSAALHRLIRSFGPDVVVIEQVSSMPGQGVASTFKFGVGYGMVQGVVAALGIETRFVTPAVWKRYFGLRADKEAARARAIQLWPATSFFALKGRGSARAEAALIARYWAERMAVSPKGIAA